MALFHARRLINVEEYHLMSEVGILKREDRVELIQGEIFTISPIGSKHAGHVKRINRILNKLPENEVIISVQDPVKLNDFSEPEPDIAILKFRADDYTDSHPGPEDIILIIEVADSSLEYDQQLKLPNYALANIPVCWIVDLENGQIEVYTNPKDGNYSTKDLKKHVDVLRIQGFDLEILVSDILS
ncbi:MAG: Uma2 family endonuclease [Bacteroidia bacterium]|nr:Uma2 family endonuclease [Bacteroidia bacterium]